MDLGVSTGLNVRARRVAGPSTCLPFSLLCMSSSGRAAAALAFVLTLHLGAALGLLEELGENAGEGDDEADEDERHGGSAPEADVAGRAGDLRDVGEGERKGDQSEGTERCGEDIQVASHEANASLACAHSGPDQG